ncbi:Glycoprotein 3-alpha-L-fucosyltransferase A [Holothuria leucospilota]|uniref:Fucosyltransferase n=1 Tax=Holothuria leucospilota TaxID=206669 RepID=A0A9Q0YG28_HOLLE|nr:Glycoprotein 3-alpha-L-fucosyltransferase A [Holothuria leucospilota]
MGRTSERYRPDGQMWIYMTKESPLHAKKARSPDPERLAFNWTMTYRRDSDFSIPYGRYTEDISEVPADDNRNWATGKTRLIAWMASNCGVTSWGRTKFVKSLKNLIQVDTYGACGTLKCPRNERCDEILSSHKFYLALENSQCEDYITEKFWRNAFTHNLVPIVYGTSREDYEKVAPPNSFIHLSDFDNMTSLVDYIKYLDKNDTAYNEYFEWRKRGTISCFSAAMALSPKMLCDITKRVKDTNTLQVKENRTKSKIANMSIWNKRSCQHLHGIWNKVAPL